ncbi:hypothetical protein IHN63_00545 [Deinococcus sp. 6YEL10]|uniref:hypothetical protein n=1 Tax=Deinococcus sp. 6YEL10 TaxID=2745870 RepID=UPI001E4091C0|nr:hypothetical protein [Deinococcus sp. 6YEL10]MCD0159788.1 hypothetical protein [Deinococcus sp. 6YEL10]
MPKIKRYTLSEEAGSYFRNGVLLGTGDVLVCDFDARTVTVLDDAGEVKFQPRFSEDLFGSFTREVDARARSGHLVRLQDNTQTRQEITDSLVVAMKVNAHIKDSLENAGITLIDELIKYSEAELREKTVGLGNSRMAELKEALAARGLKLRE